MKKYVIIIGVGGIKIEIAYWSDVMGLTNISSSIAFGAGFLSFFSPCILPLIPAYIMYMADAGTGGGTINKRLAAITRTFGFVLGFSIIFMIMGSSASLIGKIFIKNREMFRRVGGVIIIAFGLSMAGIIDLKVLNLSGRLKAPKKITNWFGATLMGMVFAVGWTPCFGPVLASILIYAGGMASINKGIYLLFIYSVGMAIPFILTAIFVNVFNDIIGKLDKVVMLIPKVGGLIMILFGILMFFDRIAIINRLL